MRRLVAVITVLSLVSIIGVACAPGPTSEPGAEEKRVKVGLVVTFTGPPASNTAPMGKGQVDYFQYLNDEFGGIEYKDPLTGKPEKAKLDIEWVDTQYKTTVAVTAYKRMKDSGVVAIMGTGTDLIDPLSPLCSSDHIVLIGGAGASPSALNFSPDPLYYIAAHPTGMELDSIILEWFKAQWKESRSPRAGYIDMDVPAQRRLALPGSTVDYAKEIGFEYLHMEWVPFMVTDSNLEVTRMMTKEPDLLIIGHVVAGQAVILKDMQRLGLFGTATLAVPNWGFDPSVTNFVGDDMAENLHGNSVVAMTTEDVPGVKLASRICQKYQGEGLSLLYEQGFAGSMFLAEGIRIALEDVGHESFDGTALRDSLLHISNFDTGGLTHPITVDPNYPVYNAYSKILVIKGGKTEVVTDWLKAPKVRVGLPERFQ